MLLFLCKRLPNTRQHRVVLHGYETPEPQLLANRSQTYRLDHWTRKETRTITERVIKRLQPAEISFDEKHQVLNLVSQVKSQLDWLPILDQLSPIMRGQLVELVYITQHKE